MREIKEEKLDLPKIFLEKHSALKYALERGKTPEQIERAGLGDDFHHLNILKEKQKFGEENQYLCLVYESDKIHYSTNKGYILNLRYGRMEDLEFQIQIEKEFKDIINQSDVEIYCQKVFNHHFIKIAEFSKYTNLPEIFEENEIVLEENNLLGIVNSSQGEQAAKDKCLELITIIAKNFRLVDYDDESWFPEYYYRERKPEKVYLKRLNSEWEELK